MVLVPEVIRAIRGSGVPVLAAGGIMTGAQMAAAMAMGAPTWYSTFTVVVPTALTGIVTGALLAFGASSLAGG